MSERFLNDRIELHCGDCLAVLPTLAENSMDSFVSDPPYHLTSIVKRFGAANATAAKDYTGERSNATGAYARASKGFMGKQWDGGDIAFRVETWREVFRVLKPGAHLVAFSGTRTYHRMVCAIEDAGFEIRDQIQWLYGSGFPKSHDVGRGIDKAAGAEREIIGIREYAGGHVQHSSDDKLAPPIGTFIRVQDNRLITSPATDAARQWQGWGTALKPACEPIVLARKPLSESTVAANVLKWGTGALNIDGARIDASDSDQARAGFMQKCQTEQDGHTVTLNVPGHSQPKYNTGGRWPANVILSDDPEVQGAFPDAPGQLRYVGPEHGDRLSRGIYGDFGPRPPNEPRDGGGSAARFFYTAKADADDRLGSKHPTVKPLDLMQYLVRLVTPKGGLVLDPFSGTGTTGEAAWREGFRAVLIEREEEYQSDIRRRMALCQSGPDERARESIKARTKDKPVDHGPLFGPAMTAQTDDTERPSREIA